MWTKENCPTAIKKKVSFLVKTVENVDKNS